MVAIDRTEEFLNAARLIQQKNYLNCNSSALGSYHSNVNSKRNRIVDRQYQAFSNHADEIFRHLANTYSKTENYIHLVKKKTLFNERNQELENVSASIKNDIKLLKEKFVQLQTLAKDYELSRQENLKTHTSNIVLMLQTKLAKISNHYIETLKDRTEILKKDQIRRNQFSSDFIAKSNHVRNRFVVQESSNSISIEMDMAKRAAEENSNSEPQSSVSSSLAVLPVQRDCTNEYLMNRADEVQNIESTVIELGAYFNQISQLVKEQHESVVRIDSNTEAVEMDLEAAQGQILKYFQSISSNRWLMIKVFAVLMIFFVLFVTFFA